MGASVLTISGGGTLNVTGTTINNNIMEVSGSGTLAFGSSLTLASGSTNVFEISTTPLTNSIATISGALTCGGTLIVTNIGANALAAGDSFKLFNAGSYNGSFANVVLPSLPAGLGWNTNALNIAGTISVITTATPVISPILLSGDNLAFSGTGGVANANFYLLGSTNLSTPVTNWTRLLTNQFDGSGNFNFDFTNAVGTNAQTFYLIQVQ